MDDNKVNIKVLLKHHFGMPKIINWSFPIFVLSLSTCLFFIFRCVYKQFDEALPVTSLAGFTLLMALYVVSTLVLPGVTFSRGISKDVIGKYSGIGALLLSFLSGLPLMLIYTSLHNLSSWVWLRVGFKTVFPALFYYTSDGSIQSTILIFIAETLIPAFGCCFFFFGLLWSRFRSKEKFLGGIIVAALYMVWSMNPMMSLPLFILGAWCFFLRTTVNNIWGPFLCLISMKLSENLFLGTLSKVNLLDIQAYSDINPTYLYASFPSLIFGLIFLIFFRSALSEFTKKNVSKEEASAIDSTIPAFSKGINLSVVISGIIFIVIFILLCKGVHL